MSAPAHAVTGADPVGVVVDPMPLGLGFATLLRDAAELLDETPFAQGGDNLAEYSKTETKRAAEEHGCGAYEHARQ